MKKKFWQKAINLSIENKVTLPLKDKVDLIILTSSLILIIIGVLAINSSASPYLVYANNYKKQILFFLIGIIAGTIVYYFPLKYFSLLAYPIYILSLISLLGILVIGKTVYGAQSWVGTGSFGMQPAEFAKLATILALAKLFSTPNFSVNEPKFFIKGFLIFLLPFLLILKQPDLGTALVFISIFIVLVFWDGISVFAIFSILSPAIVGLSSIYGIYATIICLILVILGLFYFKRDIFISMGVLALNLSSLFFVDFFIKALSPHQIKRIETFIDPMKDPLKGGYNVLQSIVAIGSGGFLGKGYLNGSQTQLKFIPEQWTDFIFCVIGEEFGFLGSIIVLALFISILYRMVKLANFLKSRFRSNIIIMIVALFTTHITVNIGMAIGIMPVIGIPLPLISYGGSSLITNILLISIVLNFYRNRTSFS